MFQSLRSQFLLPLVLSMFIAVAAVALGSYWRAAVVAKNSIEQRLRSVAKLISNSTFPLTPSVLDQMHDLSSLEIAIINADGKIAIATIGLQSLNGLVISRHGTEVKDMLKLIRESPAPSRVAIEHRMPVGAEIYDVGLSRLGPTSDLHVDRIVAVLSPHDQQRQLLKQALGLPIATGVSVAIAIGGVATLLAARIGRRLERLRAHVGQISLGTFEVLPVVGPADEIADLTNVVNHMTFQLRDMQTAIHAHQRATLINQIASGMAHQLRNSLTGARLAVQVHQRNHGQEISDDLVIAVDQLKLAEQSIQSLLQVRTGIHEKPSEPMSVAEIMHSLNSLLKNKADHKSITIQWRFDSEIAENRLPDGQAVLGALLNLMINGIEAAPEHGTVDCAAEFSTSPSADSKVKPRRCRFIVRDDGPGPSSSILNTMFEPFTTTKLEGIGLGLPMANRIAQRLDGSLTWERTNNRTVFVMSIPVLDN